MSENESTTSRSTPEPEQPAHAPAADVMRELDAEGGGGGGVDAPNTPNTRIPIGLTVKQYAASTQLPEEYLTGLGLSDVSYMSAPAVRIPYRNEAGEEVAARFRRNAHDTPIWRKDAKQIPYGLWRLTDAMGERCVLVVADETECHLLWNYGIAAVAFADAKVRTDRWAECLRKIPTIYVVESSTDVSEQLIEWITSSILRESVRVVRFPSEFEGVLAAHQAGALKEIWESAKESATTVTQTAQVARQRAVEEAEGLAQELLDDPNVFDRIDEIIRARGYAGSTKPPLLAYVVFTSRLLERPMNLVFVAPSGSGKNRAVNGAMELMPLAAYFLVSASSPLVMVYTTESFTHRIIVVLEADSIPDEGPAGSAIRSLAADSVMIYEVVVDDPKTGGKTTQRIVKEGPTGLITTTTKRLPHQLGTRMLEEQITDSPGQVRKVMEAHARSVMGGRIAEPHDLERFAALQTWLALAGEHRVVVPYAELLVDLVPAHDVRMNRDFRQLLACIQALALLRQRHRPRTNAGEIVAIIDDYANARDLLIEVFDAIATDGVTTTIRETVAAVPESGQGISQTDVAGLLKLSASTVSERLHQAEKGGWLVNDETQRGRPARWKRGAVLPVARASLPTVELLRRVFGCAGPTPATEVPPPPYLPHERIASIIRLLGYDHGCLPAAIELALDVHRRSDSDLIPHSVAIDQLREKGIAAPQGADLIERLDAIAWKVIERRDGKGGVVKILISPTMEVE